MKKVNVTFIVIIIIIIFIILYNYLSENVEKSNPTKDSVIKIEETNNIAIEAVPQAPTMEQLTNGEINLKEYYDNAATRTIHNVTLKIKEDTLTRTGATFILTDKNRIFCDYGSKYKIEVRKNEKWEIQPPITDMIVWDLSISTPGAEISEVKKDWSKIYGRLENGEYRLGISVYTDKEEYVYANFTIK